MEIKNGIIIDGVLHEIVPMRENYSCDNCSLEEKCDKIDFFLCVLITGWLDPDEHFVNRGKVTDIKIDKEE